MECNRGLSFSDNVKIFDREPDTENEYRKEKRNTKGSQRLPNAYFLFCKKRRTQLHFEHPDMPSRDVTKILAEEWKGLSQESKSIYIEEYKKSIQVEEENEKEEQTQPMMVNVMTLDGQMFTMPALMICTNHKNKKN